MTVCLQAGFFEMKNSFLSQGHLKNRQQSSAEKGSFFQPRFLTPVQEIPMEPCNRLPAAGSLLAGGNTFGSLNGILTTKVFLACKDIFLTNQLVCVKK